MSGLFGFSGISSGIQWSDMVDQIMALEARPAAALRARSTALTARTAAWDQFRARVTAVRDAANALSGSTALGRTTTSVSSASGRSLVSVASTGTAQPGEYSVRVLARAERARLGGDSFAQRDTALGISGEFLINGQRVELGVGDTLDGVAERVNRATGGKVAASVTGAAGNFRLVLTASDTGDAGIDLVDGQGRALRALGVIEDGTQLKHQGSAGFASDTFAGEDVAVAALRGITGAVGTVGFGSGATAFDVALDLGAQSLGDIRDAINSAAEGANSAVRAAIVTETVGDRTTARLELTGTLAAADDGGVLEQLGMLTGARGAVTQEIAGAVLGASASSTTRLDALGAGAGDTIRFEGARANGTKFTITHTIGADDTLQTVLDRLNGNDGFDGSATASISADGRLSVRAAAAGTTSVALAAFAGNESGGSFDTGKLAVTTAGRAREIVAGANAVIEVDGVRLTRASNTIADAVPGLTLNVLAADAGATSEINVARDVSGAASAVRQFVDAYNALAAFTDAGVGQSGAARPALAGDLVARGMRDMVRAAFDIRVIPGVGEIDRLAGIGVTIGRDGRYSIDAARLDAALRNDLAGVTRLFQTRGETSTAALTFLNGTDRTAAGNYDVAVSAPATRATATGAGFGGSYAAVGAHDRMTVSDSLTGGRYSIALDDGLGTDALVERLNTEFGDARAQVVTGSARLYADAGQGSVAAGATLLADLYDADGVGIGLDAGSELTFSGVDANGAAFVASFRVDDPATQTLADVIAAVGARFGADASVSVEDGQLVVRAARDGASSIALNVSSTGAAESPFGTLDVSVQGRAASSIRAENVDGQLRLMHGSYGPAGGMTIEFSDGMDGAAALGLAAGSHTGTSVEGTIGGLAAVGVGQRLSGVAGGPTEGLEVLVDTAEPGAIGSLSYSRGVAAATLRVAELLLGAGDGSIRSTSSRITETATQLRTRAEDVEARLEKRRESLVRRFTAMERAMATAQAQSQWLTAQLASLQPRQRQ